MKVFSFINTEDQTVTVAKLESMCIQAAHSGHAQGIIKLSGNTIQILIPEKEMPHEHTQEQGQQEPKG